MLLSKSQLDFTRDRPFDCVDFELLFSSHVTWSENEVLKHGLTMNFPAILVDWSANHEWTREIWLSAVRKNRNMYCDVKSFALFRSFLNHMIFKYMRKSRNFHAGLSGACSDKFSSCS